MGDFDVTLREEKKSELDHRRDLHDEARAHARSAKAPNTERAYQGAWSRFASWCEAQGVDPLPASSETAILYIVERARSAKWSTLCLDRVVIGKAHRLAKLPDPFVGEDVREVLRGIRKARGPAKEKAAITIEMLRQMLRRLPETPTGIRDRAILLVGFSGAFRCSELSGLMWEDVRRTDKGMEVTLRRSKTDQWGQGRKVGLLWREELCAVRALLRWQEVAGKTEGLIFELADRSIFNAIKRALRIAEFPTKDYGSHSLRIGFVTEMYRLGVPEKEIQMQTGHRSSKMVHHYVRYVDLFTSNPTRMIP